MNTSIYSSILTSIAFDNEGSLYGLGLKDQSSSDGSVESSYNPLLLKFDFK